MSHWHRIPRAISVRSLVQRCAKCILLDRSVEFSVGNLKALSKDILTIYAMDPTEKLSRAQIVRLCQEMHGLLLTADIGVLPALITEGGAPWGVLLLPHGDAVQADTLQRLTANQLVVKPSIDLDLMTEHIRQNRLLIDVRQNSPSIGVFCNCRWSLTK
jgi:hypothetical protein